MNFKKLFNEIESWDSISLFRHANPDYDAFGSQLGLAQIIKDNFPDKQITIHGSFSCELGVKIFAHNFNRKNSDLSNSLGIVLDTGNAARIDDPQWTKCKYLVKIDHHPEVKAEITKNGWVDTTWSATCEGIVMFCQAVNLKITKEAAKWLYIGLIGDNGRFMYQASTSQSLECGAILLKTGMNKDEIHNIMYTRDKADWELARDFQNLAVFNESGLAYIMVPRDFENKWNNEKSYSKKYINILAGIEEIKIWAFITFDNEIDMWKISIRSRGIECNDILYKMEIGGGHKFACAARHKDLDVIKQVLKKLEDKLK